MMIDARGQGCPKPVLLTEEAFAKIAEGVVEVLVDNHEAAENIRFLAQRNDMTVETAREGNNWRVRVVKHPAATTEAVSSGPSCGIPAHRDGKDILMVIATDSLGRDEALGAMLLKGFFETMKAAKETPRVLFFVNAGVKLTTLKPEIVAVLKELEAMGTEIYSCGTCLKYFELENALQVGLRGTTSTIVENMVDRAKTVWIG